MRDRTSASSLRRAGGAATHPAALALLAAGGASTAWIGWPGAVAGAAGYAAACALAFFRGRATAPRPREDRPRPRTREVIAIDVRLRRAFEGVERALASADRSVVALLGSAEQHVAELGSSTSELIGRADRLRLHIDAERAVGRALDPRLEARYADLKRELERAAEIAEALPAQVLAAGGVSTERAEQVAREAAAELEHLKEIASALDEVTVEGRSIGRVFPGEV